MITKRKAIVLLSTAAVFTSLWVASADSPQAPTPGSVDDPVITKSYFEQRIAQQVAEALNQLQSGGGAAVQPPSTGSANTGSTNSSSNELKVIKLEPEQTLFGATGTEIIVRTGKAVVVASGENGIADVTGGKDIIAGATAAHNHLLIIPGEGRGLQAAPKDQQKQDVYIMVRGSYTLVEKDGS